MPECKTTFLGMAIYNAARLKSCSKHLTVSFLVMQSVNTFIITARECTRALNAARMEQHGSLKTWLACTADTFGVEFRIAALKFLAWWSSMRVTLKLDRKPKGQLALPTPLQGAPAA